MRRTSIAALSPCFTDRDVLPSYITRDKGDKPWRTQKPIRSEEHTSELQSLMRISYAVFCLKKKKKKKKEKEHGQHQYTYRKLRKNETYINNKHRTKTQLEQEQINRQTRR